jgi:DNA-damage-inducible protein J
MERTISDAIRLLLVRVGEEKTLPFGVNVPNAETVAAMQELERGEGVRFSNVAELMTDLNADD